MRIFGRAASLRAFRASLASGYPLHHPRRYFVASRVVPLLSLSLLLASLANEE
jgi:hypothetical protein